MNYILSVAKLDSLTLPVIVAGLSPLLLIPQEKPGYIPG